MSSALVPHIANLVFSTGLLNFKRALVERKRKRLKQPHVVTVYLSINDAYSYLLLQVLGDLKARFSIEFDFRCVLNKQQDMYPAPTLWHKNAFNDGIYLSNLYQLDFPKKPNHYSKKLDAQVTAQLLHWELQPGFLGNALPLFEAYWQGNEQRLVEMVAPAIANHTECYNHHLLANENLLKDQGHYLSAMMHYGGEWYWGLDRLQYLEQRFNELALNPREPLLKYNLGQKDFCGQLDITKINSAIKKGRNNQGITMYWSVRSPYSYIAIVRARQLAKYYQVPLVVKPVLPMVMRRMQVPGNKKTYIQLDAKREASACGLEFGKVADPLGKGVERCYALYEYARSQDKGLDFLENYARGVWSQGIRSETDAGLKKIVESVGLNWQEAKKLLQDKTWQNWTQRNLAGLYDNDLWGVPSFTYGDVSVFGQDRIDCLERAIVKDYAQEHEDTLK